MAHIKLKKHTQLLFSVSITALIIGVINYNILQYTSRTSIESHAMVIADIVARTATVSRSVYSKDVVKKLQKDGLGPDIDSSEHPGYVPIPAQFLKLVATATSNENRHLFSYRPVSKWNISPEQGLDDDFLRWGWQQLEQQDRVNADKAIDWQPIWRFEMVDGEEALRFLYADPASNETCVNCHNDYEQRQEIIDRRLADNVPVGKRWTTQQLMGALAITVPLSKVKSVTQAQATKTSIALTLVVIIVLFLSILYYRRARAQMQHIDQLDWAASHDPLTNLLNRRGLEEKYQQHKYQPVNNAILCYIDLDKFKPVNDTYGHNAGDRLLKTIAFNLTKQLDSKHYIVRLGGDEFAVVYFDVLPQEQAAVGEQLLDIVRSSLIDIDGEEVGVSASIGIAPFKATRRKGVDFLAEADAASYKAKRSGANQTYILTE